MRQNNDDGENQLISIHRRQGAYFIHHFDRARRLVRHTEHTNNEWKQIYWLNEECWKVQAFSTISWRSGWRVLNCLSSVHQTTMDREWSVQSDIGYIYLSASLVLISRWIYKIYNREKTKSPVLGVRQVLCDRNHVHVPKPNHIPNCRKNWYALPAGIDHYIHI